MEKTGSHTIHYIWVFVFVCVGGDYISIPCASQHMKHCWGRLTRQDNTTHTVVGPSPISVLLSDIQGQNHCGFRRGVCACLLYFM